MKNKGPINVCELGCLLAVALLLTACATRSDVPHSAQTKAPLVRETLRVEVADSQPDKVLTSRVVTNEELLQTSQKDPSLSPPVCREILARLNARAPYHISEDIRSGRSIKAPNDFKAYFDWTPLPKSISEFAAISKVIVVVKEYPFIGWYDKGRLQADSYACVGKMGEETEAGVYKVEEKDVDHVSRSYNNSFGRPAWMPWAMRIYDHVWIHAGDVTGAYCSHGCVILPVDRAQDLYAWADSDTWVVVIDSLEDLRKVSSHIANR